MKPHESPRINKKSIRGNSGDSWPVWNRGITGLILKIFPAHISNILRIIGGWLRGLTPCNMLQIGSDPDSPSLA